MKKRLFKATACFFALLLLPIIVWGKKMDPGQLTTDLSKPSRLNGTYSIEIFKAGNWIAAGSIQCEQFLKEKTIDLRGLIPTQEEIRIKLTQKGGNAAHIDSVLLGENPPIKTESGPDSLVLKKLSVQDFDVIDATGKTFELTYPNIKGNTELKLTARVEPETISKIPFQFPKRNLFMPVGKRSKFYRYQIDKNGTEPRAEPFFKEYCTTGSGHPSGFTYGWVSNDDKNLYVKIDFTPDNTMDGEKDYAQLHVRTNQGIKSFKVSENENRWGSPSFIYTDNAHYEHKVYDIEIPLKELGVTKFSEYEKPLMLAFSAYGTASPIGEDGMYWPVTTYDPVNDQYLVVYEKYVAATLQVWAMVIDADGTILTPDTQIYQNPVYNYNIDVAYDNVNDIFMIVWEYYPGVGGDSDIYSMSLQLGPSGGITLGTPFVVNCDDEALYGDQMNPSVAFDSADENFVVVWEDGRNSGTTGIDIYSQSVGACPTGSPCSPRCIKIDPIVLDNPVTHGLYLNYDSINPDIAYDSNDDEFLVVWEYYYEGMTNPKIFGQFLEGDGSGTLLYGENFPVSTNWWEDFPTIYDHPQYLPSTGYDDHNDIFLVAWEDSRNVGTTGTDIYAQRIMTTTSIWTWIGHKQVGGGDGVKILGLANDWIVTDAPLDQENFDLIYNPDTDNFLIAWDEHPTALWMGHNIYGHVVYPNDSWSTPAFGPDLTFNMPNRNQRALSIVYNTDTKEFLGAYEINLYNDSDPPSINFWIFSLDHDGDGLTDAEEEDLGTNPMISDTDSDGLTDLEEDSLCTDPTSADTDGDGYSDGAEVNIFGTDPCNVGDYPSVSPVDSDLDGLSDEEEIALGTDPFNPDTDGDGLSDFDESISCTGPLNPDTDSDGFSDGDEVNIYGTNPCGVGPGEVPSDATGDGDGDGLTDGQEAIIGTGASDPDSDDDTLSDGQEVREGMNPKDEDTDGDGVSDDDDDFPTDPTQWADFDGDNVGDNFDSCPRDYNPKKDWTDINGLEHLNEQPDFDNDGIGDVCDKDADNDGFISPYFPDGTDCDDMNPNVYPGVGGCTGIALVGKPPKNDKEPDADGDGVLDSADNCPGTPNLEQEDSEDNGAGDGVGDACDSCPTLINPNQEIPVWYKDLDGDGFTDGQTIADCVQPAGYRPLTELSEGVDCNDNDDSVNPHPERSEIEGNGKDDDCDPNTPDIVQDFNIDVELSDPNDSFVNYGNWMPEPGSAVEVSFSVQGSNGEVPGVSFTFSQVSVTSYPGEYINDPSEIGASPQPDFDLSDFTDNSFTLVPNDYGGMIIIHAEVTINDDDGTPVTLKKDTPFPIDSDKDGMADGWEEANLLNKLVNDADQDADNDGLTNFEEYRGYKWGKMSMISGGGIDNPNALYYTDAYLPAAVEHIRTDPKKRSLFVAYSGFDDPVFPFAVGPAFVNSGIDLYAMQENLISGGIAEQGMEAVKVSLKADDPVTPDTNEGTFGFETGHIIKRGVRDYSFSTLGLSNFGGIDTYGANCIIYKDSVYNYFKDRPYIDGNTLIENGDLGNPDDWLASVNTILDIVSRVEDADDDGVIDKKEDKDGDGLDGDYIVHAEPGSADPWNFNNTLSPFNVDGGENPVRVELPLENESEQYTLAQVTKHVITHEIGHNIGITIHTEDPACVMYKYSSNWRRDDKFSQEAQDLIMIHK